MTKPSIGWFKRADVFAGVLQCTGFLFTVLKHVWKVRAAPPFEMHHVSVEAACSQSEGSMVVVF